MDAVNENEGRKHPGVERAYRNERIVVYWGRISEGDTRGNPCNRWLSGAMFFESHSSLRKRSCWLMCY